MNNIKQLGLMRFTDYVHQDEISSSLSFALEELYDTLGCARENARDLEDTINVILYGTGAGQRNDHRSLRQRLLDPRG